MSPQRFFRPLHLVMLSSLFTFACSRPLNCALEGCNQNNGVTLASDLAAGQSADATANDGLDKKIKEIFDRLGATEALAALLQETIKLHETRLKTLENHASGADGQFADINDMLKHHEDEIHAQQKALKDLEGALTAKMDAQAALEKAEMDQLKADLDSTQTSLTDSIQALDTATKASITEILERMAAERLRVDAADAAVAQTAHAKLLDLQTSLNAELVKLQDADAATRLTLANEIARLDIRVSGAIESSNAVFAELWTSFGLLQDQLELVSNDNKIEHMRIRNEIDQLAKKLRRQVSKLKQKDQKLAADVLDLYSRQNQTQSQLDTLKQSFDSFVAERTLTDAAINSRFTSVTNDIAALKTSLEAQIDSEAARINEIMGSLIPSLTKMISELQTQSAGLSSSLTKLETSLTEQRTDFDALKTEHEDLRLEFETFANHTSTTLDQLKDMLAQVETCSAVIKTKSFGPLKWNYVELTCGDIKVELKL